MSAPSPCLRLLAAAALLGWLGCGGGSGGGSGGGTGTATHPPVLSNLAVAPAAAYLGSGGGTASVSASFGFTDSGGDLASLTLVIKNSVGATVQTLAEAIPGASGTTQGSIYGQATVSTTVTDLFTFLITVTDRGGATSNALSGTFRVAPVPTTALPVMPTPRYRVASATLGSLIYTLGGGDSLGNSFATVEAFDPAAGTWSAKPSMALGRDGAVVGVMGGKLHVAAGGLNAAAEVFDPATGMWSAIAPLPTPRQGAAGCELGGRLYVVGGNQGFDTAAVEAYDPGTNTWSTRAPLPLARSWAGACALNGRLYIIGGYASSALTPWLTRVDIYEPATDTWSAGPPLPVTLGLYQMGVATLGGKVVVFGGGNAARALDTIYRLDPATGVWTQGAALPRVMAQFGTGSLSGLGYLFDTQGTVAYDPTKDLGPLY